MKTLIFILLLTILPNISWGQGLWERQGDFYYLTKDSRENFKAEGAGPNSFTHKYISYEGVDFLVRGPEDWKDYGRLNLEGNNAFQVPIHSGMKIEEIHFLSSGNYGNSYEHDALLHFYGENYYYGVLTVTFIYMDGTYKILSAPIFWDWFHLPSIVWSKDGVKSKAVGINPVRPKCTMYHISFTNPKPIQPIKDILVSDSWLSNRPFSDVFALTIKSSDQMQALPKKN